jgi:ElaB/YqjD/DUF883 family membrane-anchored ribosome-binding protein
MDVNQMTDQANQAMDTARTAAHGLTEKAQQAMSTVRESAQGLSSRAKSTARDAGAAADLYVHEYTWTTMALVAVTAGVLGYLLARRDY